MIAAGGTRNLINGDPQNPQWDPNLPEGTRISQMGPYLAEGTHVHRNVSPASVPSAQRAIMGRVAVQMAIRDSRAVSRPCCKRFGEAGRQSGGGGAKGLLI